jgi:hypothetical protein
MADRAKVLVKEKIADAGIDLLRERFDVEVGTDWADGELESRIGEFDAIIIRSATKMTPELIGRAERLRAIGRAGTGVDNVDIRPPPSAGSSSRTRPSRTRWRPPSTRWPSPWRCSGTSRRRTRRSSPANGRARASAATSSTRRRSA